METSKQSTRTSEKRGGWVRKDTQDADTSKVSGEPLELGAWELGPPWPGPSGDALEIHTVSF